MSSRIEQRGGKRRGWVRAGWVLCAVVAGVLLWRGAGASEGRCGSLRNKTYSSSPLGGLRWQKQRWRGRILRRLKAGPYTYLSVAKASPKEPRWLVVWGKGRAPGDHVRITAYGSRKPFYSARLKRCFPQLFFGRIHGK